MLMIEWKDIDSLIQGALGEDVGDQGDITTDAIVPADLRGVGELVAKANGVIAGLPVFQRVYEKIDSGVTCHFHVDEGQKIDEETVLGHVSGSMNTLLKGERVALNFLQRCSGIATKTDRFVEAVQGTKVKILDTRKTTPRLRGLEKYAVRQGGGVNHRFGLYDMIMIKDNHIAAAGSISIAVKRCLSWLEERQRDVKIEVETKTLEEVREAMEFPVHRIMLDNMPVALMKQAVTEIGERIEVEASGNITLDNVRSVAETGVDFISIGSLTHSVTALDISFLIR